MFTTMPKILILVVVLFAGAVVSIYDPNHHEPRKSYHRDPHIARQLQRHRPSSHRFHNQPRLSDAAYQQSANVEQQERHANQARPGWDYANNIDQHYEGCPPGFTGMQPYPYDCRRFVNCWKGRAYIQTCGPGTVFNDQTLECDHPTKVVCRGLNAKEVQTASSNRVGRLQSSPSEVSCPKGFTGLQPHPHECSKFLNCANGVVFVMSCGPQTMFNPKINACDFAHKVDCSGRNGGGSGPSPSQGMAGGNRGGKTFESEGIENQAVHAGRPQRKGWSQNQGMVNHGPHHGFHHGPPNGPHNGPHRGPHHGPHHGPPHDHTNCHHPHHRPMPPTSTQMPPTSTPTTEPFPIIHRDRWSNMNRARPSAVVNTTTTTVDRSRTKTSQQSPPSRWTTTPSQTPSTYGSHGSSGTRTTTASTPSNYPNTYDVGRTDTTSTTNIYYAQPVDEDQPSEEIFAEVYGADVQEISLPSSRRNGSRGAHLPSISRSDPPSSPSLPIPNLNLMPPPPVDDDGQSPLSEEYPDFDFSQPPPSHDVSPFSDDRQSTVPDRGISSPFPDQYPDYSFTRPSFAPKGDDQLRPPSKPKPSPPSADEWQSEIPDPRPSFSSPHPSFSDPNPRPPPQWSFSPGDDSLDPNHVVPDESNLWGGMLPPLPPPPSSKPTSSRPVLSSHLPRESTPEPYPAPYPALAPRDESNLWGGMLPPPLPPQQPIESEYAPPPPPSVATPFYQPSGVKTNVPAVKTYPPPAVQNAITRVHASPLYSPSYSGISHSRDGKVLGSSTSRTTTTTTTTQRTIEPEIIFSRDEGVVLPQAQLHQQPATTTRHHGVLPPDYNREFYKQTTPVQPEQRSSEEEDEVGQLPISEAIRLLLRPYFNRSGTVTGDVAAEAESHIMSLARSREPTSTRRTTTSTTSTSTTTSSTTTTTTVAPPAHKDVELVFSGEQESLSSGHGHAHPAPSHAHPPSKYHYHQHSRDFHRTHTRLPNPFDEESREHERNDHGSPLPEIDPAAEDVCEFYCGNGKCIKSLEVCDGVVQCDNRRDEEKCEHLGYEIRLSNGDRGRVEVKVFGQWGYVCDDKFGIEDANVVCRELGYPLGASEVRGNSFYPPDEGRNVTFVMDELDCKGTEKSLRECPFQGWGVSDCGRDEVVGIQCKTAAMKCPNNYWLCKASSECIPIDFVCDNVPDCSDKSDESASVCNSTAQYRLKGGKSKQEGRLEVLYRNVWGTICDDDFSQNEAQVACNSLGYYGKAKIVKNAFGPGSGPIWLDQVSCVGNESAIDQCTHWSWGEHNCNHTEDVSLKCTAGSVPSAPKADSRSSDEVQTQIFDDVGIDFELLERSSKFKNNRKMCGHFNANLTEPAPLEYERVVRGNIAKRGHHPWQATIRTKGQGGISSHWCGAVLISKKHLLTAAHCLVGYPKGAYFIRLGDHIANIAESSEIDSYIEDWYVHEKFREGTHMNNDIAVIVLKNPVRFNDYIQPICLPQEGSKYDEGRLCTISGWGSIQSGVSTPSNNLRAAQIPVMSDDTCKLPHVYGNLITDGMFCAGYLDEGVDACEGDSGGPFVCSDSGSETLYGIISWGKQCGHSNKPGVYVRIEKYIDWIYGKIRLSMQQTN